jgi:hypothetical protein
LFTKNKCILNLGRRRRREKERKWKVQYDHLFDEFLSNSKLRQQEKEKQIKIV